MARPQSPHRPSDMELAGSIGTGQASQDVFRTPHPPHVQDSPSSVPSTSSLEVTPLAVIKQESMSSYGRELLTEATELERPMAMHWTGPADLSTDHASLSNTNFTLSNPLGTGFGDFFPYTHNGMSYSDNYNIPNSIQYPTSSCSRSYPDVRFNSLPQNVDVPEAYPPSVYQIEPQTTCDALSDHGMDDHLTQMRDDYEHHYGSYIKRRYHTGYDSPYSDMTRASTPACDSPRHPLDMNDGCDDVVIDKEQPYAQLIYQALLQADGHTMILRDIYDWFLKYTDKAAASETKGWQNSIRHNLSMNGAFEKVDQPGEDSRKGFMWRLTERALREGVKSTTRYRSKQPNKRGNRMQHPQPLRQASGAKGGQAARRSANMKRSKRVRDYRNELYMARSVPSIDGSYTHTHTHAHEQIYPTSPYYSNDIEFAYNPHHNKHNGLELFPPPNSFMGGDSAYLLAQSPSEPLFTDSPTPSAEEPRTPMSGSAGWSEQGFGNLWQDGEGLGMGFQEYAG